MRPLDENQRASAEQFGKRSANYGRGHILANVADVESVLRDVEFAPGSSVLDVATGGGHTALYLARRGLKVTIGDVATEMLDAAARLLEGEGFACTAKRFPAEEIPFADQSFGGVTCRVAAHHFSSPQGFAAEVARVLKPGGWFLLIDGSVPDESPVAEEWLHTVEKLRDPSHGRFFSRNCWQEIVKKVGLKIDHARLTLLKQPDLEWYFDTAGTSRENREKIMAAVSMAPPEVIDKLGLSREDGKIVWWWPRLSLLARKPDQ